MKRSSCLLGIILLSLLACKKNAMDETELPVSPLTGTRSELTLDSIYLYAKQVYLWNDILPSYQIFNPRQYLTAATGITAFRAAVFNLSQLKNNPLTLRPYEEPLISGNAKYSYLENTSGAIGNSTTVAAVGTPAQSAVLQTTMLSAGGVPVAYIALGAFPLLSTCKTALDNAFATFSGYSPQYLVVDLRSNSGGYVETAEYVANLIAPSSLSGKIIYTEQYNSSLQLGQASILKNQPYLDANGKTVIYNGRNASMADVDYTEAGNTYRFSKRGKLNTITEIYFIVSANTASASELLISSLKPYLKVKLIGQRTYGKPVGFLPLRIDTYSLYISSFLIKNSEGWSDYFTGIPADILVDMPSAPLLGDPNEACLQTILSLIKPSASTIKSTRQNATPSNAKISTTAPRADGISANLSLESSTPSAANAAGLISLPLIETRYKLKN
jgi:hypothetical protein